MSTKLSISDDRVKHILSVARKCYEIAKNDGAPEEFCQRMFVIGWLHDVGYEFADSQEDHAAVGAELLQLLGFTQDSAESAKVLHAIKDHGRHTETVTSEWRILNEADMQVDSKGNEVSVQERMNDIAERYGFGSQQYCNAHDVCIQLGLYNEVEHTYEPVEITLDWIKEQLEFVGVKYKQIDNCLCVPLSSGLVVSVKAVHRFVQVDGTMLSKQGFRSWVDTVLEDNYV